MNIKELAKLSDTSIATISRVVNHKPGVSSKKRLEIQQLIQQHGYSPNVMGQGLSSRKSFSIGVLLESLDNPYYAEVLTGIAYSLSQSAYSLQLCCSRWQRQFQQQALQNFMQKGIDGLLAFAVEQSLQDFQKMNQRIPVMLLDYEPADSAWNFISTNNMQGGYAIAEYLVNMGHKNIYIVGARDHQSCKNRIKGFLSFTESPFIREHIQVCIGEHVNSQQDATALVQQQDFSQFSAIFCVNDLAALYTIEALEKQGFRVPKDISVFGYDDLAISRYFRTPISTVSQAKRVLGELAATEILWQVENERREYRLKLQPELVVRRSTSKNSNR